MMQTHLFNRLFVSTFIIALLVAVSHYGVAHAANPSSTGLVPCVNDCDLNSFFALLNNVITFLIKVVFFPIAIIVLVYTGYKYMTTKGNPGQKGILKNMFSHFILGMLLILSAWVIVKTILLTLGYSQGLLFFN